LSVFELNHSAILGSEVRESRDISGYKGVN